MLKPSLTIIFLLIGITVFSQKRAPKTWELGILLGRSYYSGELNPKTHVGNEVGNFAFGALARYNINRRYSLRGGLNFGGLNAEDHNVELPFNQYRMASFESRYTEAHVLLEFNFMPYEIGEPTFPFSPYLYVGPGIFFNNVDFYQEGVSEGSEDGEEENQSSTELTLPFGFGFKMNLGQRFGLSLEWGFRKAGDEVDGLPNSLENNYQNGKSYNKDWFSVAGVILTYRITKKGICPAI